MRTRDRISLCACAATLAFCALAFGGAERWAAVGAAFGGVATALPYLTSRRVAAQRSPLLVLLAIAIALTALQLVPLPHAIAELVAPAKLQLVDDNADAFGQPAPAAVMASYDPPATLVELAKLVGYAALAFACVRVAAERGGRRALAMVAVGSGALVAIVTLGHAAIGARDIYGLVPPPIRHPLLSPIINDNHFASLMSLAAPVAFGLALTSRRWERALWLGVTLVTAGCALYISSRGGALGLAIAFAVGALLVLRQRRAIDGEETRRRGGSIPVFVVAACVATLLVTFTARHVAHDLARTRVEQLETDPHWKVQAWKHAMPMLEDNPWLGIGRGSFEPAFSRYDGDGSAAYSNAENSYLETALDWGIPGALAIFAAAVLLVVRAARSWRQSPLEAGALGALAGLAAHDFVDFSMELPSVAMFALVLVAILLPARIHRAREGRRIPWRRGAALAAALATCIVAATPLARGARDEAADASADAALALCERHPADYLLAGRAAQALVVDRDPRAVAVMARALYLNPRHAGLHQLAASVLARAGLTSQAQSELALAIEYAHWYEVAPLVDEAVASFADPIEAAHALPPDPASARRVAPHLVATHRDAVAFAYTQLVAMFNPDNAPSQLWLARAALATNHADIALDAARDAYDLAPDVDSAAVLAGARAANDDAPGAVALLRTALATGMVRAVEDREQLLAELADIELQTGELDAASQAIDQLSQNVADTRGTITLHLLRARLHDRAGEFNQAKWERDQARTLQQQR
ncbi:MAG TPA: O-antigen ligase family protein [Kofleriaceae bacterium]